MVAPLVKQSWVVTGVLLNIIGHGLEFSYPSCLFPGLRAESTFNVDLNTESWISSAIAHGMTFGILITSFLMEHIGRKKTNAIMTIPPIVGCILIYFAPNSATIIIGRLLQGSGAGAILVVGSTSIGEYTDPIYRGIFLNLKATANCVGYLVMHSLATFIHWRTASLVNSIIFIAAFLNVLTWPESPSWLISKNMFVKSKESFYWLRERDQRSEKEFESMIRAQEERNSLQKPRQKHNPFNAVINILKKFTQKDFVKPVLIIGFSMVLMESIGRHTFPAHALDIIKEINGGNKTETFVVTLSLDIITIVASLLTCILIKILRRRTLLFASGIGAVVLLSCLCLYLFLVSNGTISNARPWISLLVLVCYYIFAVTGCANIPLTLFGEILPLNHRGSGTAVCGLTCAFCIMLSLKTAPYMLRSLNVYGTFSIYNLLTFFSLLYLYFALPETKNRTLQEIEDFFNHGRFLDVEVPHDVTERAGLMEELNGKVLEQNKISI